MRRVPVSVTTAADGTATVYSSSLSGELVAIKYIKDVTTPFADTVDFTITAETDGESLWAESNVTATKYCYPTAPTHTQAGVATLYAAGGEVVRSRIGLASTRVKFVIAQGGDTKTGAFRIILADR